MTNSFPGQVITPLHVLFVRLVTCQDTVEPVVSGLWRVPTRDVDSHTKWIIDSRKPYGLIHLSIFRLLIRT